MPDRPSGATPPRCCLVFLERLIFLVLRLGISSLDLNIKLRGLLYEMDLSGATLEKKSVRARRMVEEVREALRTSSAAVVASKFTDYQKEFPTLFATLLRPDYPRDVLEMLLSQYEKIETGQTTQHDASVVVGTVLVDRFVKNQLPATK